MSDLETQAIDLEDAQSDAQGERDVFFTDGAGSGFASSAEIGDEVARLGGLETQAIEFEDALNGAQDAYDDDASDAQIAAEEDARLLNLCRWYN